MWLLLWKFNVDTKGMIYALQQQFIFEYFIVLIIN